MTWVPEIDEKKDLKREPRNLKDVNAFAVVRPSCAHADIPNSNKTPEQSRTSSTSLQTQHAYTVSEQD